MFFLTSWPWETCGLGRDVGPVQGQAPEGWQTAGQ